MFFLFDYMYLYWNAIKILVFRICLKFERTAKVLSVVASENIDPEEITVFLKLENTFWLKKCEILLI